MTPWTHEIGDVLIVQRNGTEQPARVAGYIDSLDNTKPLYVNLRVAGGLRWSQAKVKIQPSQIVREDKGWHTRQRAQWDASIKATADAAHAKMTPAQKQRLHEQAVQRQRRSALDVMI